MQQSGERDVGNGADVGNRSAVGTQAGLSLIAFRIYDGSGVISTVESRRVSEAMTDAHTGTGTGTGK